MSYTLNLDFRGLRNIHATGEGKDDIHLIGVGIDKKGNFKIIPPILVGNNIATGGNDQNPAFTIFNVDLKTRDNLDYLVLLWTWEHDSGGQIDQWAADNAYKFNLSLEAKVAELRNVGYDAKYLYFQAFAECAPEFHNALNENSYTDQLFLPVFIRFHHFWGQSRDSNRPEPVLSHNYDYNQSNLYYQNAHYKLTTEWRFISTDPVEPTIATN